VTSYQLAYWVTEASGCPLGEGFLDLVPAILDAYGWKGRQIETWSSGIPYRCSFFCHYE